MNLLKEHFFTHKNQDMPEKEFALNNQKIKEAKLKEKGIFYFSHWPISDNFTEKKLLKIVESLAELLEEKEIPYDGISVEQDDVKEEPLLVVHMDRETRALDLGEDFPTMFMNLDVLRIISGKYKQYEYK